MAAEQAHPTKKERRIESRRQREELLRRKQRRQRTRKLISVVAGVAVLGGAVAYAVLGGSDGERAAQAPAGVQSFDVAARNHVEGEVDYAQDPPAGGDHNPVWQNCGFYDAPIVKENAVHALEHGAVWITYRPDLPADQVQTLRDLAASESFILATPYPQLQPAVAASAWGRQLTLDSATDPRLEEFVRAFMVGPTTPEPGAPCTGGIGEPL